MKALLIIDVQNDFLPGGSLEIREGDFIIEDINDIMDNYDLVIATKDWHPKNHISFASNHKEKNIGDVVKVNGVNQILWPDHCVQNTYGSDFPKSLNKSKINKVILKGMDKDIDSYSGFFDNARGASTLLSEYLKSKNIDKVDCVGLATEYCVKFSAIDSSKEGFQTRVILKCCRGINKNDIDKSIQEMRENNIVII